MYSYLLVLVYFFILSLYILPISFLSPADSPYQVLKHSSPPVTYDSSAAL